MTAWTILKQVEEKTLNPANIKWPTKLSLLNHGNDEIKSTARKLLVEQFELKDEAYLDYQHALSEQGNRQAGKEVFKKACSTCHQMAGQLGINYGPDLSSIRNRSKMAILNDILYPNKAIADGFGLWEVEDNDGKIIAGILAEEGNNQLLFRLASGQEVEVNRQAISKLSQLEQSGMPDGLSQQVPPEEMRDLISYLRHPL